MYVKTIFFKVIMILTGVKIKSTYLLKFIINFTRRTNTSVEAAATPADLAVCFYTKSRSCTIPPYPDLPSVSSLCWTKPHLGVRALCRHPAESKAHSPLSSTQEQQPQQFLKLQCPNTFNLSFHALQWHYSAGFKVYQVIFELAIILFPVLQSPADQGKLVLFPVVTTASCDHLLLDPIRCKKAPAVKPWSLQLSLMDFVILNRACKWRKLHDK